MKPTKSIPTLTINLDFNEKKKGVEKSVFNYFKKQGFREVGYENEPIFDLFFHLCFEKFLLKPNWELWDKNKTIKDYPQLTEHLDFPIEFDKKSTNPILEEERENIKTHKEWIEKLFSHVPLEWMYSDDCIKSNGGSMLFGEGIYYQMFKDEIDEYIENQLPLKDIPTLMKENYKEVQVMRGEYSTLFIWGGRRNTEPLETIYYNLPIKLVQFIMKKQFENFHRYRSGFMDCWMFNKKEQHLKLVEGKRVNEEIRFNQRYWLNKFLEYGVDVSVMRIQYQRKNQTSP